MANSFIRMVLRTKQSGLPNIREWEIKSVRHVVHFVLRMKAMHWALFFLFRAAPEALTVDSDEAFSCAADLSCTEHNTRRCGGLFPHEQPERKNMGDQEERDPKDWDEITRAQQSRRVRKRNAATLVKRIQQVGSPKNVEDPDQRFGQSGPESGERNERQGRCCQITIGEFASEYSGGQLGRNDAGDQDRETDVPEPVQHEDRPECFCAFPLAYRRPNVLRGENAPCKKTETDSYAPDHRDRHDALLSSLARKNFTFHGEASHAYN